MKHEWGELRLWKSFASGVGIVLVALVAPVACGDSAVGPNPDPPIAAVVVTPATMDLLPGDTIRFAAEARSRTGGPLSGQTFDWSTDRPEVATVDASGVVTAVSVGVATIRAALGSISGRGTARVIEPVAAVAVAPPESDILVGDTVRLRAVAQSSKGDELSGRATLWRSDRADVASVSPEGLVTALGEGDATISATIEGVVGSALVRVTTPVLMDPVISTLEPGSIQAGWSDFTLEVRGEGFVPQSRVHWAGLPLETLVVSANELRATVSSSYVVAEGSVDITVETPPPNPRTSNALKFTVFSRPALTVELTLAGNAVFVGDRLRLSAVARDQFGEVIVGKTITWSSSDSTVARVEGDHIRALRLGSVDLVASATPARGEMRLSVVTSPVAAVVFEAVSSGYEEAFIRSLDPVQAVRRLLPPGTRARQVVVTTDGGRIAFVGEDASGNQDIYVANRDGSGLQRVTTEVGIDDQPAWSPDGGSIAFRSFRQGKSDIWVMDADGGNQRNLTFATVFLPEEYNERPAWSPDAGTLVFSRGFGITSALYKIGADGSGMSEFVARSGVDLLEPSWSADGGVIAFRRRERAQGRSAVEFVSGTTGEPIDYAWLPPAEARTPELLPAGWIAVSAPMFPGSAIRTVALMQMQMGYVVVPVGEEYGMLAEPGVVLR